MCVCAREVFVVFYFLFLATQGGQNNAVSRLNGGVNGGSTRQGKLGCLYFVLFFYWM